jgi:hypothetical protein
MPGITHARQAARAVDEELESEGSMGLAMVCDLTRI